MKASGMDTVSILGVSDDRVKLDNDGLKKAPSKSVESFHSDKNTK